MTRALATLDVSGVEGIVFDVDDTLTRGGVLEREAFDALWSLRERGLGALAVTGRPLGWSDAIASTWPVSGAVGENGAGWAFRRGGTIEIEEQDAPEARLAQRASLDRILDAVRKALPDVVLASDQPARRRDLAFDVGERASLDPRRVAALVTLIEGEGARALVSSVHAHAIPGAWDKARGAVSAARSLGIDEARLRSRWIFVGDSGNDAAAFAFFERTVGVANVAAHLARLPVPPRYVTPTDRGRGFAELVRHVLSGAGAR